MTKIPNKPLPIGESYMKSPRDSSPRKYRYSMYLCGCGNEFESDVYNIHRGTTKSCGCYKKTVSITHGKSSHPLYSVWAGMIDRTTNTSHHAYDNYGGRGILVCDEWKDIDRFVEDMYPSYTHGLTIDRIDNEGGYSKSNCRWTDMTTQSRNTRKIRSTNSSGYRGVSLYKRTGKWRARIRVNYKEILLGYYDSPIDAAKAYDRYVIENNLEHTLNQLGGDNG